MDNRDNNNNNTEDLNNEDWTDKDFFDFDDDFEYYTNSPFTQPLPETETEEPETEGEDQEEQEEDEEEARKKKIIKIAAIVGGIIIAILIIIYIWGCFYFSDHFLPRTHVNGIDVSRQTVSEAVNTLNTALSNRQVNIIGKDGVSDNINGAEVDLTFNDEMGDLDKLMREQNRFLWPYNSLFKTEFDLLTKYKINKDKLNSVIANLSLVKGADIQAPQDAKIVYNGNDYVIQPAVDGNQPNVEKLTAAVEKALVNDTPNISLAKQSLYNMPAVTADNATLKDELNALNTAIKAVITINFPSQQVVLNKTTFNTWLIIVDNQVTVNDEPLNAYVADLANRFNTKDRALTFTSTNSGTYTFTTNVGWELNQAGEAAQLKEQILAGSVVTEDPVWAQRGYNSVTGTTISGTYVEVSLNQQMLWFYRNNSLVSSSTIVSGDLRSGQATQRGLFFIQSKDTNVNQYVRLPDGSSTNIQVRYWLPYTTHYGIESASWRNQFGGDIYRTQGSNGDVDVPVDLAQTIYNGADVGTPVVIY